jgi:TrmH family RNA methyltransferase
MLTKSEIKLVKSLKDKKVREEFQLFVAEGKKLSSDLITAGMEIAKLFCKEELLQEAPFSSIPNNCIQIVSNKEMEQLSALQSVRDVVALVKIPTYSLPKQLSQKLSLALDTIQDPGNLGTIIRLADWYGIEHIFCSEKTADCYNSKVIQSSMGSIARVQVHYVNLENIFKKYALPVLAADLAGTPIQQVELIKPAILLIGNEGSGIHSLYNQYIQERISIPRIGEAESLNAAIACGIITHQLLFN